MKNLPFLLRFRPVKAFFTWLANRLARRVPADAGFGKFRGAPSKKD